MEKIFGRYLCECGRKHSYIRIGKKWLTFGMLHFPSTKKIFNKSIRIRKVKVLNLELKHMVEELALGKDDMVIITMEKIEGSPTQYLQEKYLKL